MIKSDAFLFFKSVSDLFYKALCVPDVVGGMSYYWSEDVSQLLCHPICDCTPAGTYRPKEGVISMEYG